LQKIIAIRFVLVIYAKKRGASLNKFRRVFLITFGADASEIIESIKNQHEK
jgi:hypothetical protein